MADDKMDKDLERQYRKNLMVVASIVLIYSIAGGEMGDAITMLGANLKFSRPDWLEWAMVTVMCFFWWRHFIVSKGIRKEMISTVLDGTKHPIYIKNQCILDIEEESRSKLKEDGVCDDTSHKILGGCDFSLIKVGLLSVQLRASYFYDGMSEFRDFDFSIRNNQFYFLVLSTKYRINWIKHAIFESHFGDAILPSVTFLAALVAYGSLKLS